MVRKMANNLMHFRSKRVCATPVRALEYNWIRSKFVPKRFGKLILWWKDKRVYAYQSNAVHNVSANILVEIKHREHVLTLYLCLER